MKNQINSTIKAHLLRGAFYLLLLVGICAIPFALAQSRNGGTKRGVNNPTLAGAGTTVVQGMPDSAVVKSAATSVKSGSNLLMPKSPQVVLYDQYDNDLNSGIVSADRTDDSTLSAEAADNFVVPGGETWNVAEVDIRSPVGFALPISFTVNFYLDNGSGLPGTQVYTANGLAVVGNPDYIITLTTPAVLTSGTYWVSAIGTISGFNWYWEGRSVTSNTFSTAWRNPLNGYGTGCTDWAVLTNCIGINWPDQMFRLVGDIVGGTPSPTPSPSPTPTATATATPTSTPGPGCGLLIGDGLTIGYAPNDYTLIASNIVNYTFSSSQPAPNDYAIFQTHNPWDATIVEDAITAAGHTFSVFTPAQLAGFVFSDYRVIVLNWDDTLLSDFLADYTAAIPALEAYVSSGGVVWVQGAIQGAPGDNYPLPFGGQSNYDASGSDPIVDPSSPMMAGVPNPIVGNFASHVADTGLPADAHVVVINGTDQNPVLYDLFRGANCGGTPSPTPTATATATATPTATPTPTPTGTPAGCVFGQGYWKNHPEAWPVTELQLGNVTYNQQQLLDILHQPVRGNGLVLLAHQLIAAELNIANGSDPSCIQQTIDDANALIGDLVVPPVGDGYLAPRDVSALAETLDQYNEGMLCAPSCEQGSPPPTATPRGRPRPTAAQRPR